MDMALREPPVVTWVIAAAPAVEATILWFEFDVMSEVARSTVGYPTIDPVGKAGVVGSMVVPRNFPWQQQGCSKAILAVTTQGFNTEGMEVAGTGPVIVVCRTTLDP